MALDPAFVQLVTDLGELKANVRYLESRVAQLEGGASSFSQDNSGEDDGPDESEGFDIPGLGKVGMGSLMKMAMDKAGGPDALFAKLANAPPAPAPAVPVVANTGAVNNGGSADRTGGGA